MSQPYHSQQLNVPTSQHAQPHHSQHRVPISQHAQPHRSFTMAQEPCPCCVARHFNFAVTWQLLAFHPHLSRSSLPSNCRWCHTNHPNFRSFSHLQKVSFAVFLPMSFMMPPIFYCGLAVNNLQSLTDPLS